LLRHPRFLLRYPHFLLRHPRFLLRYLKKIPIFVEKNQNSKHGILLSTAPHRQDGR
jgi:hypothetical protein